MSLDFLFFVVVEVEDLMCFLSDRSEIEPVMIDQCFIKLFVYLVMITCIFMNFSSQQAYLSFQGVLTQFKVVAEPIFNKEEG